MSALDWLLDSDTDPAIRWQAMRDLTDANAAEVAAERSRVAHEGWGGRLLSLQGADGRWDGGAYRPGWASEELEFFDAWTATHFSLRTLTELGADPMDDDLQAALDRVRSGVRWWPDGPGYFDGETEPCINGLVLANGAYFGEDVGALAARVAGEALPDGGWNCWAEFGATVSSFHTTICVLEGLLAAEVAGHGSAEIAAARAGGEEYLLERSLYKRRSTGEVIDPRFTMLSSPNRWYYDILWGLDYLRRARPERDPRCADAIELLRRKQQPNGLWAQENVHQGATFFGLDNPEGNPSPWLTLRALRVLRWWDAS